MKKSLILSSSMKKAFITGITGQDGSYLAELLLDKNYEVHGTVRRSSSINTSRIDNLISEYSNDKLLNLHYSDLTDPTSLDNLLKKVEPDEIYNLGAQSHVHVSFLNPLYTSQTSVIGVTSLLESVKNLDKEVKFYQASSSEMFGGINDELLNENSILEPKSPYAAGKVYAHHLTKIYRESYGLFCVNGILFNHESPRRGETFVTRKITRAVSRIKVGLQKKLTLGNLDAYRDWGYAKDFVEGMYLMMSHETADDWVLATGETHTVKEFLEIAFSHLDLDWQDYVSISDRYFRPNEVKHLLGDPKKAKTELNWNIKTSFEDLVELMVESDIELAKKEKVLFDNGMLQPTWEHPNS
jgi:GDPmannose 4,6-dehydratase